MIYRLMTTVKHNTCKALFLFSIFSLFINSCGIYSFKGSTLSPDIKTFTVIPFTNQASIVVPSLSNTLTEKLKDKFISEMKLSHDDTKGDLIFKGVITQYKTGPASITSGEFAATTRLTISVKVTFENTINPDQDYEVTFSNYIDFDSSQDLSSIEDNLINELTDMLVQDIFNRAVNNW